MDNENYDLELYQIENLKNMIREAYRLSVKANEVLARDTRSDRNQTNALLTINQAFSVMQAARAVYVSNHATLENLGFETVMYKFGVFANEALTNLLTDHSHQWTFLEFDVYESAVKDFIDLE